MAKLGVELPYELDERLRAFVPWGNKGKLIEGLLILAVESAENDHGTVDQGGNLIQKGMEAYYNAHK